MIAPMLNSNQNDLKRYIDTVIPFAGVFVAMAGLVTVLALGAVF